LEVDRTITQDLQKRINRYNNVIAVLRKRSEQFVWLRIIPFLAGLFLSWITATFLEEVFTWITAGAAFVVFIIIVGLHRRLDRWIRRYEIFRDILEEQCARATLDWPRIPDNSLSFAHVDKTRLQIDLDLTGTASLHQLIDLAVSVDGSRLLASWLSEASPNLREIQERQGIVRELMTAPRFMDKLLLDFRALSKDQLRGERLLKWLNVSMPMEKMGWVLTVSTLLAGLNLGLFILNTAGILPAYWLISLPLYMIFYYQYSKPLAEMMEAVVDFDREMDPFKQILHHLETYPFGYRTKLTKACAPYREPGNLPSVYLRRIKRMTSAVGVRSNPILGLLLNFFLPWDFYTAFFAGRLRDQMVSLLPEWVTTWYRLEAMISLATFGRLNPEYVFPEITSEAVSAFEAAGMGHPLIHKEQKRTNDIKVASLGEVAIITGSNMAGKSTFVKTIGVNLCLAYAGAPVNAINLRSRPFRLHTCIRITDSITDGFSYFYAEVKCLKCLLEELKQTQEFPLLYLVDEIFRGTNNRERLIGSRSYIEEVIGKAGIGFIATHDLELAKLDEKSPMVTNYHFRDYVQDGRLAFDYQIHPGASPTTNALKIMEMEGLPVERSQR